MIKENKKYIIYMHTSVDTGKSYIGLTSKTIDHRFKGHLASAKKHNKYHFHRALNKLGKNNQYNQGASYGM